MIERQLLQHSNKQNAILSVNIASVWNTSMLISIYYWTIVGFFLNHLWVLCNLVNIYNMFINPCTAHILYINWFAIYVLKYNKYCYWGRIQLCSKLRALILLFIHSFNIKCRRIKSINILQEKLLSLHFDVKDVESN